MEWMALVMFVALIVLLMLGYPVAFTLGAVALLFGGFGLGLDFLNLLPLRIWGVMTNFTLLAVPLFIFMGAILEKSGLAEDLLETMGALFGRVSGGLALSVIFVGGLLAASTGVVGATVVTMGLIALPAMLKHGYKPELATGVIAASGTLGQLIPPSIILVLLGDVVGVPVGRLFMGAILPGALLIIGFMLFVFIYAAMRPESAPRIRFSELAGNNSGLVKRVTVSLLPPLFLILAVLGSIFLGIASPTESAAVGALGALILASGKGKFGIQQLKEATRSTTRLTSMVFLILVGATAFGLVFRGLGGDILVREMMTNLPGGHWGFLAASMLIIFILGFFLDFLEISFIVVPILAPIAQSLGIDLLWFTILIAVNLQTSFLTPPFGFSLFYLKAVVPPQVSMGHIYRGIIPFIAIQVIVLAVLVAFPDLVSWLPDLMDKANGLLK